MEQNNFDALGSLDNAVYQPNDDGMFGITILNAVNGQSLIADVFPENTLGSIAYSFKDKLGFQEVNNRAVYVNTRTGKSCSDSTLPIATLEFSEGDTLSVNPYGTVAFYQEE